MPITLTTDTIASRTVATGWGTASDGTGTWSGGSTNSFASVGSNEAQFITVSGTVFPYQYISNVTATDSETLVRVTIGATGNQIYPMARMQSASPNNCYRAFLSATLFAIQKVVSGTTTTLISTSATPTPASFYWIRFRVVGTKLYATYWLDGTSEPSSWTLSTTSSSFNTVGNYGIGSTLTTTTAVKVDNVTVNQAFSIISSHQSQFIIHVIGSIPTLAAQASYIIRQNIQTQTQARFLLNFQVPQAGTSLTIASDTFTRANQSGWGTASDTEAWNVVQGNSANYSIVSNKGQIANTVATYSTLLGTGTINSGDHFARITPSASGDFAGFTFAYVNSSNYCYTEVVNSAVRIYKVVNGGAATIIGSASFSITGGTAYRHHLNVTGTTAKLYVYADGGSQPGTPTLTVTDAAVGNIGRYGLHAFLNNSADTIKYDSYSVVVSPHTYYVSSSGSDSNVGTQQAPFATLQKATSIVQASDTVYFLPGQVASQPITSSASGTPTGPISYLSTIQWGATVRTSGNFAAWINNGDFVTISGFDIAASDTSTRLGVLNNGSRCLVQLCHVHDIQAIGSGSSGGGGIDQGNLNAKYNDTIRNLVHDIGVNSGTNSVHCIYHACMGGVIQNNVVYHAGAWGIHLWHGANSVNVCNNLSFNNGYGGIIVGGVIGEGPGIDDYTIVANNIIAYNAGPYGAIYELGSTGTHNQYLNNLIWQNANIASSGKQIVLQNSLVDLGTITADPLFNNYQSDGSGDYHLQFTSPAIAAGIVAIAPLVDYHGFLRLFHTDLGPYQYIPIALFPTTKRRDGILPTIKRRQS